MKSRSISFGAVTKGVMLLISAAAVSAHAYVEQPATPTQSTNKKLNTGISNFQPGLGAIDAFAKPLSQNPFLNAGSPSAITFNNNMGFIALGDAISDEEYERTLNIGAKGKLDVGKFNANGNFDYYNNNKTSRYQRTFTFLASYSSKATYNLPPGKTGTEMLSPLASSLVGTPGFQGVFGDSFISSADAGAKLLVSINIDFNNASDKHKFDANLDVGYGTIGSIMVKVNGAIASSKTNATLKVSALQLGGDPRKLSDIFGQPDSKGTYPILKCSAQDTAACTDIVNNVIYYSNHQFKDSIRTNNLSNLYFSNPSFVKYQDLGLRITPITVDNNLRNDVNYLLETRKGDQDAAGFLSHYIDSAKQFTEGNLSDIVLRPQIATLINGYQSVLQTIQQGATENCFQQNANKTCSDFVGRVKSQQDALTTNGLAQQLQALKDTIYIQDAATNGSLYTAVLIPLRASNSVPVSGFSNSIANYSTGSLASMNGVYAMREYVNGATTGASLPLCMVNFSGNAYAPIDKLTLNSNPNISFSPLIVCTDKSHNFASLRILAARTLNNQLSLTETLQAQAIKGANGYTLVDNPSGTQNWPVVTNPTIFVSDSYAYSPM